MTVTIGNTALNIASEYVAAYTAPDNLGRSAILLNASLPQLTPAYNAPLSKIVSIYLEHDPRSTAYQRMLLTFKSHAPSSGRRREVGRKHCLTDYIGSPTPLSYKNRYANDFSHEFIPADRCARAMDMIGRIYCGPRKGDFPLSIAKSPSGRCVDIFVHRNLLIEIDYDATNLEDWKEIRDGARALLANSSVGK